MFVFHLSDHFSRKNYVNYTEINVHREIIVSSLYIKIFLTTKNDINRST